jgi:hypothetical protein
VHFDSLEDYLEKLDSICSKYSAVKLDGNSKILTWLPIKPEPENCCF